MEAFLKMKKYEGREMVNRSRFIEYVKKMPEDEKQELYERVDELIYQNREFCDKRNHQHLCNIFTSIALYKFLQKKGFSEEEAYDTTAETMYAYMRTRKEKFEKMAGYPIFWRLIRWIVPVGFKYGSGAGWRYTWHKDEDENVLRFECNECIYQKIFRKHNFVKLGPMFCKNDVIVYGELPGIDFQITGTLCQGHDRCDFCFIRHPAGEAFTRSKSR